MSSNLLKASRTMATTLGRRQKPIITNHSSKRASRGIATSVGIRSTAGNSAAPLASWCLAGAATAVLLDLLMQHDEKTYTSMDARTSLPVIMAGNAVQEPDTGIMFPPMVNGFTFMGCGVRIKYIFVKVYAVGCYFDPTRFVGQKDDAAIEKALLDPGYHRTIRIVMNRAMTMQKYNDAIVEVLTPRMNGQDMDKLEEFKKLNPPGNLEKDTELLMTIRGDTLLYKNASGNIGTIQSEVFTKAMCDVYFGSDPVSPQAKQAVVESIKKM